MLRFCLEHLEAEERFKSAQRGGGCEAACWSLREKLDPKGFSRNPERKFAGKSPPA